MRNSNFGCIGLIALLIVIGLVWNAILYVGMPVGLIGGLGALVAYRKATSEGQGNTDYKFKLFILGAASIVLFIASAAGNFFTADGPLSRKTSTAVAESDKLYGQLDLSDPKDRAIAAEVHHCSEGWAQKYLTYEDCLAGKTMNERMLTAPD